MGFDIVFWYWWVAAVIFLVIEIMSPSFFFLWLAVSAVVTGFLLLLMPFMNIEFQLLLFGILSISSVLGWKYYMSHYRQVNETDHPLLNQRGAQYIGRTFTLIQAIENGQGKVKVDDSPWKVEGEDCPKGSTVKVVAVDGTVFKVIRVD
jgi:membrane protein implicated in regulation of membrane protease activity